jgi:hypothetical protein
MQVIVYIVADNNAQFPLYLYTELLKSYRSTLNYGV